MPGGAPNPEVCDATEASSIFCCRSPKKENACTKASIKNEKSLVNLTTPNPRRQTPNSLRFHAGYLAVDSFQQIVVVKRLGNKIICADCLQVVVLGFDT